MRIWVAWIIGILSWLFLSIIFDVLVNEFGMLTYVNFGETIVVQNRYYEQERDGTYTQLGMALNVIAAMISARIGMAIYAGKIDGGVSKKGNIDFLAWAAGISLYGVQGAIFLYFFEKPESELFIILLRIIDIVAAIVIASLCYNWRNKEIHKIENLR